MKRNIFLSTLIAIVIVSIFSFLSFAQDTKIITEDVTYTSEGNPVKGKIYRPKDKEGPQPAIVLLPGRGRDFLTPIDHSLNMYGALRHTGNKNARLEIIDGAGHFFERGFSGYAFKEVVDIISSWFDNTLRK